MEMEKQLDRIRADINKMHLTLESLRAQFVTIHEWILTVQPGGLCVTLQPGECHTFQQTTSGGLTITNEADEHGMAELKWANDVFTGEVQSTSTRIVNPLAWPATICNVGTVPLKVCPA